MSGAKLDFTPEALREIDEAFEWYLERSVQAAESFVREVDGGLALVGASPTVWPIFHRGTRRYVLRRFPYDIVYRDRAGGVQIVAIAHHKRRPGYWQRRLGRDSGE